MKRYTVKVYECNETTENKKTEVYSFEITETELPVIKPGIRLSDRVLVPRSKERGIAPVSAHTDTIKSVSGPHPGLPNEYLLVDV
jgi:hypothetical protein